MWQAGYKNIVNIDVSSHSTQSGIKTSHNALQYSKVVIEKMQVLYPDRVGMECTPVTL